MGATLYGELSDADRTEAPTPVPTADVTMIRSHLDNLPEWALPDGYRLRLYREGDKQTWLALHADAEPFFAVMPEHFDSSFGADPGALFDRMFFVETLAGEPVGTSTAWWQENWDAGGPWGQVHWVAVARAHQRRGLAKSLVASTLRRLSQDYSRAMLGTNTARIWAIKMYLDAGFLPNGAELDDTVLWHAWAALQARLQHPALEAHPSFASVDLWQPSSVPSN